MPAGAEAVSLSPVSAPFGQYAPSGSMPSLHLPSNSPAATRLKPFLGLWPRIILTAFNPALLPLVFTIAHLAATRASTAELAQRLKDSLLSACGSLAGGAGALQALPRYLAMQTNDAALRATRATVLAVGSALMSCVTVIEVVVNFIVDTYRSILLCTIELVVRGSLELLISAVQTITDAITTSLNSIRAEIQEDIGKANDIVQAAVRGINRVTSLVDVNLTVPNISIPSLNFLANVTVPTGFEDSLIKLNATLPSLSELKDKMEALIDKPFHLLKAELNETRLEIAASLNDSSFPVPSLKSLGSNDAKALQTALCGDLDTSFIDDTASALHKLGTVAIGLMCLVLVLGWGVLTFYQWRRWVALRDCVETVESDWVRTPPREAWTTVAIVEHPMIERYARPVFDRFKLKEATRANIRWLLSYLGHPTCLTLLVMSVVGLIALEAQLAALHALKAHAQESASASVGDTTDQIAARLNALSANASAEYAHDMNLALYNLENRINGDMFGPWINTTAVQLNATLVEFYADVEKTILTAFGGTPLFGPINTFVYCLLGSKVVALEKGLTWVSEHAHISLPRVPVDVLLLSNASAAELAAPVSAAAVGEPGSDDGAIPRLVRHFEEALEKERIVYGIMLGLWGCILLAGLAVVLWHSGGREAWDKVVPKKDDSGNSGNFLRFSGIPFSEAPAPPRDSAKPGWLMWNIGRNRSQVSVSEKESKRESNGSSASRLRVLAAPGQAFLKMREFVSTPAPADEGRKWAPLQSPAVDAPLPPLPGPSVQATPIKPAETAQGNSMLPKPATRPWVAAGKSTWVPASPVSTKAAAQRPETPEQTFWVSPGSTGRGVRLAAARDRRDTGTGSSFKGDGSKVNALRWNDEDEVDRLPTPDEGSAVEAAPPRLLRVVNATPERTSPSPNGSSPPRGSPETPTRPPRLPAILAHLQEKRRREAEERRVDPFVEV